MASLIGGRLTGALFSTAWLVLAARVLEPREFGGLAVVIGVGSVAAVVAEGGYPLLVAEAVGSDHLRFHAVIRGALIVRLPLSVLAGVCTATIAGLIDGTTGLATGAAYGIWIVASAAQTTFGPALRAIGRVHAEAMGEAASRVLTLMIGSVLLWHWQSPVAVTLAYAAGTALADLWLWWSARHAPVEQQGGRWVVSAHRVLPLGVAAVLVTLYNRVDIWLLALLSTTAEVGIYAAGYRFYEGLVLPATAFGALLVPASASEPGRIGDLVRRYVAGALAVASAGSLVLVLAAPTLVRYLLGDQFQAAVGPIRILSVAALPATVFSVVAPLASLRSRQGGAGILLLGLGATALLNVALIPPLGPTGAAVAMVLSQSLMAGCFLLTLTGGAGARADESLV